MNFNSKENLSGICLFNSILLYLIFYISSMRIVYLFVLLLVACRPSNQIGELVGVPRHRPLEETVWILEEINEKVINPVEEQKSLFVLYHLEGKKVEGFGGCNAFTGAYTKEGFTVSAKLTSTRMFCEEKMDLENEFMKVLALSNKYMVEENHLFFKNKDKVVAEFHAEVKKSD